MNRITNVLSIVFMLLALSCLAQAEGTLTLTDANERTFMVALWIVREAWAFFKEKANKTGERVVNIDGRLIRIETQIKMMISKWHKD